MRFGARFSLLEEDGPKQNGGPFELRTCHTTQLIVRWAFKWAMGHINSIYNHLLEPKLILYLLSTLGFPLHRFKLNMLANTRPQGIAKIEGLDQKLNKNNTAILADTLHFESEVASPVRNTQSYQV